MKLSILLEMATSQTDVRQNQTCEAWQDTQEMFTLSEGESGCLPDQLGAKYLDPEVVHPLCAAMSASVPETHLNTFC